MNGLVHVEDVMGTAVVLDLRWRAGHEPDGVEDALVDAVQVLHDVDLVFSTWRPDSSVSRLRRAETGLQSCPPEVREVVLLCVRAMRLSAGWFDPWRQPGGFDPTGLVKGWAAKRAAARLSAAGITDHCVNAGGDVCVTGSGEPDEPDSWTVGITDPEEPSRLLTCRCKKPVTTTVEKEGTAPALVISSFRLNVLNSPGKSRSEHLS